MSYRARYALWLCRRRRRRRHLQGPGTRRRMKRVGVIGTFVWDIIYGRDPRDVPVEEWGGITYALGAFDAALPPDWQVVPLVKVGSALAPKAPEFLRTMRRVAPDAPP